jgi:hypothetical protein
VRYHAVIGRGFCPGGLALKELGKKDVAKVETYIAPRKLSWRLAAAQMTASLKDKPGVTSFVLGKETSLSQDH